MLQLPNILNAYNFYNIDNIRLYSHINKFIISDLLFDIWRSIQWNKFNKDA